MKKIIFTTLSLALVIGLVTFSCKSKNNDDALTPGWTTTSGNPTANTPGNATTTGTLNTTSSAQNSSMTGIGQGSSWSSSGCSGSSCITVSHGSFNTVTTLCFAASQTTLTTGTYQIVEQSVILTPGKVHLTVTSPVGQELGSIWYAMSGVVNVSIGAGANGAPTTGNFTNIVCKKAGSNFPIVTISGQVGCI